MTDVFISYASTDRDRAALVAREFQARGWSVWWDRTIPPGRQYDEVIEEALAAARCVVMLWSQASTASAWVKYEAGEALQPKALIPALVVRVAIAEHGGQACHGRDEDDDAGDDERLLAAWLRCRRAGQRPHGRGRWRR